ncbi:MAG: 1-acyl-sn-glycerol-3-phosphate acyltransferase [Reichenbachiella sp.]
MKKIKATLFWKVIERIYMAYAAIVFVSTFLLILPVFFAADIFNWHKLGLKLNHYWAYVFFFLVGVPMEIRGKNQLDKNTSYIFCPNHFSFLDIAILPFVPIPFKFVGKLSIGKVPFFGYMFKTFHITVDRSTMRERYATYKKSVEALKNGFSLAIFPEGGIKAANPPKMNAFKEGPFRMSIETGTPVVPVTMADNWHMFPDDGKFKFHRRKCRMVIHEPIDPGNYSIEKLQDFQDDVYHLIQKELDQMNSLI